MGDGDSMNMSIRTFGKTTQGEEITMYKLETEAIKLGIIDYGTTLVSLCVKSGAILFLDMIVYTDMRMIPTIIWDVISEDVLTE